MMDLFQTSGVHCIVDGQFGSTGKGALAAYLANDAHRRGVLFSGTISNAGPNSGHTSYVNGEKIVLKQLPSFSAVSYRLGKIVPVYLTAGAIIDMSILYEEAMMFPDLPVFVHPMATIISRQDVDEEQSAGTTINAVAGTRKGVGAALSRKVRRDPTAIIGNTPLGILPPNVRIIDFTVDLATATATDRYFMEVSQGFSLGLNSEFYPKVTSRECTVMQGLADARIPASSLTRTYMSVRTYPIRVGDADGHSSGDIYSDQDELSWGELGLEPEYTTVTNRMRRVFTWSNNQFYQASIANQPDFVFINFLNYLSAEEDAVDFIENITSMIINTKFRGKFGVIGGYGPNIEDVRRLL